MSNFLFKWDVFLIFSESSETCFDLVASKIVEKHNNLVIYVNILDNFLWILNTKFSIFQKPKIAKIWKLSFSYISAHYGHFWWTHIFWPLLVIYGDILVNFMRILSTKLTESQKIKIRIFFFIISFSIFDSIMATLWEGGGGRHVDN